jgi:hypothetical protein
MKGSRSSRATTSRGGDVKAAVARALARASRATGFELGERGTREDELKATTAPAAARSRALRECYRALEDRRIRSSMEARMDVLDAILALVPDPD